MQNELLLFNIECFRAIISRFLIGQNQEWRENPRVRINCDNFYHTVYRRFASQRGNLIDGLVTRLVGRSGGRNLH